MQVDKKTTVPVPPAPTDGGQPYALPRTNSIAEDDSPRKSDSGVLRNINRIALGALPSMTMPELMNQQFAARPAVVEGLLPMGTHLFSGAPKIGKSFFVLQLAYQVSTGEPFLGQHRTIAECAACLFFSSHIRRKNLEIRQDSGGFCNKSGRKIPARSAHLYYAVLP